jgi:1-acyl-sn-glycerol-3-phosphate acyltransferase
MLVNGPLRGLVKAVADPEVVGLDRLADLRASIEDDEPAPPVVFAANHASHVDAPLLLTSVPAPWRSRLVVGAAADYFFATRITGALSALALGAIPIDRTRVNRRSADLASSLLDDGWSLLIFPEGGRSPDGWGQPFRGGAAFLSIRSGVPVVPVHLDGTGAILGRGMKRPKPGRTKVTFGAPLTPREGEDARRFGERIEAAVAVLGDEAITDWWSARRRAAAGETPALTGPAYTGWRRAWALSQHRARGKAGQRRRQRRSWPSFD